ncbi:glycosyltransferase, partial [Paenibacillus polymyxa]|uniref:glycosyltransferase n=2 Tax=Paenibacillus TaxID=44249 RepID=UPI00129AE1C6
MKLYELYDLLVKNYETSSIKKDMDLILNIEKQKYNLDLTKFKAEYIQKYDTLPTPNITCGILTFNEERCVDRCLKSVYNIFDEIIVLDSYSTDRTVELINESYPKVKVYQEKWRDDFSFHRNRIMQLATKDWIFFIDADNWLENKETNSIPRIAKLIEFLNIECVVSPIIKESNNHIHYDNRKMIKISSGIKYYGLVHEEPLLENKQTIPYNLTLKVLLNHDGYESKAVNQQDKNLRNLTLTRKMIEIDSQNPKWFYFLANELKNYDEIQNKSKVIELLENSIKMYEAHPK